MTSMINCWQCGDPIQLESYICDSCGTLQGPLPGRTHFECLGLPTCFIQDEEAISGHHRRLQRRFHPDRFVQRSARERQFSLQHATALNDAHRIVGNRQKRAEYLLTLRGIHLDREDEPIRLNPMFLMEVIEFREALDELIGSDAHGEINQLSREIETKFQSTLGKLGQRLDAKDDDLQQLGQWAAQLRYLQRILDHVADHGSDIDAGPLG